VEAFYGCPDLAAITVDTNNPAYSSLDGVLFDKGQTTLVQYPGGRAGSYTIPNGVTSIGTNAFYECSGLTSVTIPAGVTAIGDSAFYGCAKLTSVTIPDSVITIGNSAFQDCTGLTRVTIGGSVAIIGSAAFCACSSLSSVTIPNSVKTIEDFAFDDSYNMLDVTIGNGVTNIGAYAFYACEDLNSITIPSSVISIGDWAFASASLRAITVDAQNPFYSSVGGVLFDKSQATLIEYPLGKVGSSYTIPYGVTSTADYAFAGYGSTAQDNYPCKLTSITLPASITNIVSSAFSGWASLKALYFQGNAPTPDTNLVFLTDVHPVVYYLPGTTGWGATFAGLPTALWTLPYPLILNRSNGSNLGPQTNGFGFIISWATNLSVVVQATASLSSAAWTPVATNTLAAGWSYFTDPQWTNYPGRFYRVVSP